MIDIEEKIKEDPKLKQLESLIEGLNKYCKPGTSTSAIQAIKDAYNDRLSDVIFGK